ncbi:unnamed protein product [Cunninghamella blakesleeana]
MMLSSINSYRKSNYSGITNQQQQQQQQQQTPIMPVKRMATVEEVSIQHSQFSLGPEAQILQLSMDDSDEEENEVDDDDDDDDDEITNKHNEVTLKLDLLDDDEDDDDNNDYNDSNNDDHHSIQLPSSITNMLYKEEFQGRIRPDHPPPSNLNTPYFNRDHIILEPIAEQSDIPPSPIDDEDDDEESQSLNSPRSSSSDPMNNNEQQDKFQAIIDRLLDEQFGPVPNALKAKQQRKVNNNNNNITTTATTATIHKNVDNTKKDHNDKNSINIESKSIETTKSSSTISTEKKPSTNNSTVEIIEPPICSKKENGNELKSLLDKSFSLNDFSISPEQKNNKESHWKSPFESKINGIKASTAPIDKKSVFVAALKANAPVQQQQPLKVETNVNNNNNALLLTPSISTPINGTLLPFNNKVYHLIVILLLDNHLKLLLFVVQKVLIVQ